MPRRASCALIALVLVTGGCGPGPLDESAWPEPRPLGRGLDAFRPARSPDDPAAVDAFEEPTGALSLRDALAAALLRSPDLAATGYEVRAREAEALVRLLEDFSHIPAWICFSCCDETHVCHGEPLSDCVAVANDAPSCVAVGVNCTPPRYVADLLRSVRHVTSKSLVAYPNSGEAWDAAKHCWIGGPDAVDFAEAGQQWYEAGARLVGGCCRTTPDTIRGLALRLPTAHR